MSMNVLIVRIEHYYAPCQIVIISQKVAISGMINFVLNIVV